jgi:hypothetical protein
VDEEENELFPKAKKVLSAEHIEALGEQMLALKQQEKRSAAIAK